jgi:hypothetical protein
MKILVLMSFTKEIEYDNYGKNDFSEISVNQNFKYCQKYGYDFCVDRLDTKYKDFNPTWVKIPIILKYLIGTNYDLIVWIDSDALFLSDIRLEDVHDKNITISQSTPSNDYEKQFTLTNTGFISIKNNEYTQNLFSKLLLSVEEPNLEKYKYSYWHEQGLLDLLFTYEELEKCSNPEKDILLQYEKTPISKPLLTENFKIIPYTYNNVFSPSETLFIYHASGDLTTKNKRLIESLKYSKI